MPDSLQSRGRNRRSLILGLFVPMRIQLDGESWCTIVFIPMTLVPRIPSLEEVAVSIFHQSYMWQQANSSKHEWSSCRTGRQLRRYQRTSVGYRLCRRGWSRCIWRSTGQVRLERPNQVNIRLCLSSLGTDYVPCWNMDNTSEWLGIEKQIQQEDG